jgi:hypothetical protein
MTAEEHNTINRKLDELLARTQALEAKCAALEACVDATNVEVVRLIPGKVNQVAVPVLRADGTLEVLPQGYDAESGVTTILAAS